MKVQKKFHKTLKNLNLSDMSEGLVCKTWEGQMNMGGVSNGAANTWEFTVEDEKIAEILQSKIGQKIDVNYKQEMITGLCRSQTDYFVKSVSST